jgi:hypothetical protein
LHNNIKKNIDQINNTPEKGGVYLRKKAHSSCECVDFYEGLDLIDQESKISLLAIQIL